MLQTGFFKLHDCNLDSSIAVELKYNEILFFSPKTAKNENKQRRRK